MHVKLEVQLMDDPCLWRWELRDVSRGEVVENSWSREWAAYTSAEEAYRAGQERLLALKTD